MDVQVVGASSFVDITSHYEAYNRLFDEKALTSAAAAAYARTRIPSDRKSPFFYYEHGIGDAQVTRTIIERLCANDRKSQIVVAGREFKPELAADIIQQFAGLALEYPNVALALSNAAAPDFNFTRPFFQARVYLQNDSSYAAQAVRTWETFAPNWALTTNGNGAPISQKKAVFTMFAASAADTLQPLIPTARDINRSKDLPPIRYNFALFSHGFSLRKNAEAKKAELLRIAENLARPDAQNTVPGGLFVTQSIGGDAVEAIILECGLAEGRFHTNDPRVIFGDWKAAEDSDFKITSQKPIICKPTHSLDWENDQHVRAAWQAAAYVAQLNPAEIAEVCRGGKNLNVTRDFLRGGEAFEVKNAAFVIEPN